MQISLKKAGLLVIFFPIHQTVFKPHLCGTSRGWKKFKECAEKQPCLLLQRISTHSEYNPLLVTLLQMLFHHCLPLWLVRSPELQWAGSGLNVEVCDWEVSIAFPLSCCC